MDLHDRYELTSFFSFHYNYKRVKISKVSRYLLERMGKSVLQGKMCVELKIVIFKV